MATGRAAVPITALPVAPPWAGGPGGTVDPPGTVYRRVPEYVPPPPPAPVPSDPGEHSGSLAGFLLSQERAEGTSPRSRAIIIGLVILAGIGVLLLIGLLAVNTVFESLLG